MGIHLLQWLAHRGVIQAWLSPRFFQIIYRSFNIFPLPCRKTALAPLPSYWRGAAVGCVAMAGVFEIFLDAVVDLEEVCVVAVGVVGGRGGAR